MKTLLAFIAALAVTGGDVAYAEPCDPVATVMRVEGVVKIKRYGSVRQESIEQAGETVCAGDAVLTYRNGTIALKLDNGSDVVVKPDSVLKFKTREALSVKEGRAAFSIRKRGKARGLKVETRLSVIGVKGTEFLVEDTGDDLHVVLAEGQVEVESTGEPFAHYRERMRSEFEAYRRRMRQEFEEYRNALEREFLGHTERVELEAGHTVTLTEGKAIERDISDDQRKALEQALDFASELPDAHRGQTSQHRNTGDRLKSIP